MKTERNKAVFLDRDGTINVEKHYLYKIEDFELLPSVVEGLKKLQEAGYLLIVITNQSGIARGYYTEEEYNRLNQHMLGVLESKGVYISDVFYCPHLPDAKIEKYRVDCNCRKPKLGMFYDAVKKWNIDLEQSWAIGDKERDLAICDGTGCRGIIVGTVNRMNYRWVSSLDEAARIILNSNCAFEKKSYAKVSI